MKIHSCKDTFKIDKTARQNIMDFFKTLTFPSIQSMAVIDVSEDVNYQKEDVDFLIEVTYPKGNKRIFKCEVKGDQYENTGNYFFETISNEGKNTPGCFMYTQADFLFYYFVNIDELHIIPVTKARSWFIKNQNRFKEIATSTPISKGGSYKTIGRLVNKDIFQSEVGTLTRPFKIKDYTRI